MVSLYCSKVVSSTLVHCFRLYTEQGPTLGFHGKCTDVKQPKLQLVLTEIKEPCDRLWIKPGPVQKVKVG